MRTTSGAQRRLAAIFCADVAGYTRLMNADERATLRLLTSLREIANRQIDQHDGRVANTAGDSILAEFPSAVNAVQCALAIQERIAAANQDVSEERRLTFRIGVHVGEVMVKDGDLFGDGVNIAARLQGLALPGSVCVSGAAHEYVRRMLPVAFEDLGSRTVKNLDTPIQVFFIHPSGEPNSKVLPPGHRNNEFYLARRLQAVCTDTLNQIAKSFDLEGIDCPVLATIGEAPGLSVPQLATRAGIDRATVEDSVNRLELRRFLVARSSEPTDEVTLTLTADGLHVRMLIRTEFLAAQDRVLTPLSDREREILKDLLARIIKANSSDT
jgi:adenylate cyclase